MGPAYDPLAVTDQHGRVYGIAGLWIADASIIPGFDEADSTGDSRIG
jgi:choline dehydrogenase-like flavoprotein